MRGDPRGFALGFQYQHVIFFAMVLEVYNRLFLDSAGLMPVGVVKILLNLQQR